MQAATTGGGTEVGAGTRQQVRADFQRGRQVDRVIPAKSLLLGEVPGRVDEILSDLKDRDLLPQACELGLRPSQLFGRESPLTSGRGQRRARFNVRHTGGGDDVCLVPDRRRLR